MKLYHLTPKNLGKEAILKPLVSEDRNESEIEAPRVCASPSIEECLVALHSCEWFKLSKSENTLCLFVYEICNTTDFNPYNDVFDFEQTREHIAFSAQKAKLSGIIHIPSTPNKQYLQNKTEVKGAKCVYEKINEDIYNNYYKK